jgi:hypothetical protein
MMKVAGYGKQLYYRTPPETVETNKEDPLLETAQPGHPFTVVDLLCPSSELSTYDVRAHGARSALAKFMRGPYVVENYDHGDTLHLAVIPTNRVVAEGAGFEGREFMEWAKSTGMVAVGVVQHRPTVTFAFVTEDYFAER